MDSLASYDGALAHAVSVEGGGWDIQSLEAHLDGVATLAKSFTAEFDSALWGEYVGLLHDLGKYSPNWQDYLKHELDPSFERRGNKGQHSTAGALVVNTKKENFPQCIRNALAYAIAGHHAGLPNWYLSGGLSLEQRLNENWLLELQGIEEARNLIEMSPPDQLPDFIGDPQDLVLWTRMLYSCLVDADWLDTEKFCNPKNSNKRGDYDTLQELNNRLDKHLGIISGTAPHSVLNIYRQKILEDCQHAAELAPGLFSLSVPTGGGKTLSSMSFALRHAIKYGKKRVIVAIPYTSIIEQNAQVYKYGTDNPIDICNGSTLFGIRNVLEHHSAFQVDERDDQFSPHKLGAENWDAPIVVTTNVQLFESLYSSRRSQCRKLHNLVNSVIILDEAQMLPTRYLKPILSVIQDLVRNYGVTVVLSTATQPTLSGKIGGSANHFNGLPPAREIIEDPVQLAKKLRRVSVDIELDAAERPSSWKDFAVRLSLHNQVLCIVNTRKDCRELHAQMPEGTWHLSAYMCPEERTDILAKIKVQLANGETVRVISTQLIEAGVDIDFPVVFRAITGLDSIAQSAGRCNREGKMDTLGKVVVFNPPEVGSILRGDLRLGADKTRVLCTGGSLDLSDSSLFSQYFFNFFGDAKTFGIDEFKRCFENGSREGHFEYRYYSDRFNLVESDQPQKTIIVCYKGELSGIDSEILIKKLEDSVTFGPTSYVLLRKLQRFSVNISEYEYRSLCERGLIRELEGLEGIGIQSEPLLYTRGLGLDKDCKLSVSVI